MSQIYTILFDLDGTIIDTAPDIMAAHNHVMKKFGYKEKKLSDIKSLAGKGAWVMMQRSFKQEIADENIKKKMVKEFLDFYSKNIDKESRLINVSFNMNDQLSNYVDCGTSKREFQLADFADSVIYEVANSSSYFTTSTAPPNPNVSYHKVFTINR